MSINNTFNITDLDNLHKLLQIFVQRNAFQKSELNLVNTLLQKMKHILLNNNNIPISQNISIRDFVTIKSIIEFCSDRKVYNDSEEQIVHFLYNKVINTLHQFVVVPKGEISD